MIPAWLRLVVALPFLGAGVALLVLDHWTTGAFLVFLGGLVVLGWLRYGEVLRAAKAYGLGDRDRAWKLLRSTPAGGRFLARPCRFAYHQVRASCLLQEERWEEAARECDAALAVCMTDEQRATSHTSAALARMEMGDEETAKRHYAAAKAIPKTEAMARRLARLSHRLDPRPPEADVTGA